MKFRYITTDTEIFLIADNVTFVFNGDNLCDMKLLFNYFFSLDNTGY